MAINSCGNTHKGELEKLMKSGDTLRDELKNLIKSGSNVKETIVTTTKHLQIQTENLYQKFSDDIAEHLDNKRDLFWDWLKERKHFVDGNTQVFDELKKERDLLIAECRLICTERDLMVQQRIDLEKWKDEKLY